MVAVDRVEVITKILDYESKGLFNNDVEDDVETIPLTVDKVDYLYEKPFAKLSNKIANVCATAYFENKIKKGQLVIKEIKGIENYLKVKDEGVFITCNHFHPYDNYALYRVIRPYLNKKCLNKVIKEGNYTSFKGIYGYFFRRCNTLPLSSNIHVMQKFMKAVKTLLDRKEKILIYPEQSMWWNYKKPRPMQNGAFKLAVKNNAPILPFFITMENTSKFDESGYPVQAYTINILPAIYKDDKLKDTENVEMMKNKNYEAWREVYEDFYKVKLTYGE